MAMVYMDERDAGYMTAQDQELADVWSPFRRIAVALGIRDPLAYYEPGVPLPEVFRKYSTTLNRYINTQIPSLGSATMSRKLLSKAQGLVSIRDRLRPAVAPGATIGTRDRERLAEFVFEMRELRKQIQDAEKSFGTRSQPLPSPMIPRPDPTPRPPFTPPPTLPTPPVKAAFPVEILAIGAGAILLLGVLKKKK